MPKRAPIVLAVLLLALTAPACSHGGGPGTTAEELSRIPEVPLASLVDPASLGVFRVDLAAVTSAPLFNAVADWIDVVTGDQSDPDTVLLRSVLRAREVVLYLVATEGGEPRAVALLRGRFQREDAVAFQRGSATVAERRHGPFLVHDVGADGAVSLIGSHTLVLGRRPDVDTVLDRQLAGGNGSYPTGEAYLEIANAVDFGRMPIALAVVPSNAMRAAAASVEGDPMMTALAGAQGLGLGLDIRDGLRGRGVVHLDSTIAAMGVVTLGRVQLGSLAEQPEIAATGLGRLLQFVQLDRHGSSIVVDVNAPEQPSETAFGEFTGFLRRAMEDGVSGPGR